ncbi:MAG: alpha/beta hydrolase [Pseudomonadota bacterium]
MKYLLGAATLVAILAAIAYSLWMPLPDTPARDAVGTAKVLDRDDRALGYHVTGKGPPVLLLASAGREASDFNELALALGLAGYRTIAFDAHGIGSSTLPADPFTLFDMADDVHAIVDAEVEEGEKLTVVGHAFGNRLARAFASRHDNHVQSVVLIASGGAKPIPPKADTALRAIFDPRRTVTQRKADIDYAFFADGNKIPDYWLVGWHRHTAVLQGKAKGSDSYDQWGSGGTGPMLVLQAAEDTIAPPEDAGIPLAARYPDRVELVMIAGAGHALLPEQPDAIAKAILDFMERHNDS